jgi:hypothetical protein
MCCLDDVITDSKLLKTDILKTRELLRSAVNRAPLIDVAPYWSSTDNVIDTEGPDMPLPGYTVTTAAAQPIPV